MNTPGRHKKTLPVRHPYDVSVDSANTEECLRPAAITSMLECSS